MSVLRLSHNMVIKLILDNYLDSAFGATHKYLTASVAVVRYVERNKRH